MCVSLKNLLYVCCQMSILESELRRVQEENHKLRIMLEQITKSYSQLQAQLFITLQKQKPNHGQVCMFDI